MGLGAFTPATTEVVLPGGDTFAVRGLSLEDFTVLLRNHYEAMAALFERYVTEAAMEKVDADTGAGLNLGNMQGVVLEALKVAPGLVGDCIARAADETKNPHVARLLPIGVQIEAVQAIVTLTLDAEGGLEKLIETVATMAASLTTMAADRSR